MSEVATLEQATSDAPPESVSDDSITAAEELPAGEVEQPNPEPSTDDTTPELSPDEDYAALVQKADAWTKGEADANPLSTEEKARMRSYEQSAADRQRAEDQAREQRRREREQLTKLTAEAPDRVYQLLNDEVNAAIEENRNISPSLLKHAVKGEIDAILKDAAPLVLREYADGLAAYTLDLVDTPEIRKSLADGTDFPSRMQIALNASYTRGLRESPDAKALEAANKKIVGLEGELQKLKGERGAKGSGASSEGKGSAAGAMPTTSEEWAKFWASNPDEARQR